MLHKTVKYSNTVKCRNKDTWTDIQVLVWWFLWCEAENHWTMHPVNWLFVKQTLQTETYRQVGRCWAALCRLAWMKWGAVTWGRKRLVLVFRRLHISVTLSQSGLRGVGSHSQDSDGPLPGASLLFNEMELHTASNCPRTFAALCPLRKK